MIEFSKCPSCGASTEKEAITCWSCNAQLKAPGPQVNVDDINVLPDSPSPYAFHTCKNCGAHNEFSSSKCWSCGVVLLPGERAPGLPAAKEASTRAPPKVEKPSLDESTTKKVNILDAVAKAFKFSSFNDSDDDSAEDRQKEREKKKERKLVLFHCPKCDDYFKVTFRRLKDSVNCPVCKNVPMLVSYFCTRCKRTRDCKEMGRNVCPSCHIDMILDPHYE